MIGCHHHGAFHEIDRQGTVSKGQLDVFICECKDRQHPQSQLFILQRAFSGHCTQHCVLDCLLPSLVQQLLLHAALTIKAEVSACSRGCVVPEGIV